MTDVMLDIETLGTKPGCIVLSVGAVAFDFDTGEEVGSFQSNISIKDSQENGLSIDADTLKWWLEQDKGAFDSAFFSKEKVNLAHAASNFSMWFSAVCDGAIWAQGMDFDMPIWGHAMEASGVQRPWPFWMCRDTRSAYHAMRFDPKTVKREGTHHSAIDDARHQIRCLHAAINSK